MDFSGKRVLVTGGTRGIGRAAVEAFLENGARVAVNGRSADSTAQAIASLGGGDALVAAPGDVAIVDGCRRVVETALSGLGGLDVLVNSADTCQAADIADHDEKTYDRMMDANVKGTFFCIRYALPALKESKGNIVNLGSTSGLAGFAGLSAYCASKGAIVNLTRALALELAPDIRVNSLCPGIVDTDMGRDSMSRAENVEAVYDAYPLGRIADAGETAHAVLYLASDKAGFVTGLNLKFDGGRLAGNA